ncbi:MAG TPA: hydroxyethylthiazole kinase [Longimicrobium sp.]|nr:hydroxyethylthiazole kinase [Longimicrobium sp.]
MDYAAEVWSTLRRLREITPLVHNITNYVAMDVSANALLAVGAAPAMVHALEEVEDFVAISHALVVNIGTLSPAWVKAMHRAADRAVQLRKPWVLDPVGAGATRYRTDTARELAVRHPTVIRGNASEILAVAGGVEGTRGVDSAHGSDDALATARALGARLGCVVAVTGAVDYVTDGRRTLSVSNGHVMMTRVTALGCSATALTGAFLAAHPDPVFATTAALAVIGLAGEIAARDAAGPGTLRQRLIDALYAMDEAALAGVRIAEV